MVFVNESCRTRSLGVGGELPIGCSSHKNYILGVRVILAQNLGIYKKKIKNLEKLCGC
jgi:hypothetical protein